MSPSLAGSSPDPPPQVYPSAAVLPAQTSGHLSCDPEKRPSRGAGALLAHLAIQGVCWDPGSGCGRLEPQIQELSGLLLQRTNISEE